MTTVTARNLSNQLSASADSLRQRLADALNFRRGSQPGARDYGSRLIDIVDKNVDSNLRAAVFQGVAETIRHPANGLADLELQNITFAQQGNRVHLYIECAHNGEPIAATAAI